MKRPSIAPARALPLLLLLVGTAYIPAVTGGFAWDDHDLIEENALVTGGIQAREIFGRPFWTGALVEGAAYYRPLTVLTFELDWRWHAGALPFHLTNLLLHLGVTALVFAWLGRLGTRGWLGFLLALLFGLLPRLTESVAWISGRTDLLASLAALAALWLHRPGPAGNRTRFLAALILGLGLLCKETAVAALFGMAVMSWRHRDGRWATEMLPAILVLILYGASRFTVMGPFPSATTPWLLPLETLGRYALMLVDPLRPAIRADPFTSVRMSFVAFGAIAFGASLVFLAKFRARLETEEAAMAAVFVVALGLVLHIVPGNDTLVADRFLYLPAAALLIAAARPLRDLSAIRPRPFYLGLLVLIVACFLATLNRASQWSDELVLWRKTVGQGDSDTARVGLATALMQRHRYAEALAALDSLRGFHPKKESNRATCLDQLGRHETAARLLGDLLHTEPERHRLRLALARAQARAGRWDRAEATLASLPPDFPADAIRLWRQAMIEARAYFAKTSDPMARARAFTALDSVADFSAAWRDVLQAPTDSPDVAREALAILVTRGEPGTARWALAWVKERHLLSEEMTSVLTASLDDRLAN
jgi:tetratricopeptide (TPR) repeat protein